MIQPVLGKPISLLCEFIEPMSASGSLIRAAERFRLEGCAAIPVIEEGELLGVIEEGDLSNALKIGMNPEAAVGSLALTKAPAIYASSSGALALRAFDEHQARILLVVDGSTNYVGILVPSHLYPRTLQQPRPRSLGGMATPFGVYLTTGAQRGGVSPLALMAAGALLFLMVTLSGIASDGIGVWLGHLHVSSRYVEFITPALGIALFLGAMRLSPLAGYHAAEHMVVHAIERGEPLQPDIVRRMPRVHPRCGTNLAVGAMLFIGIASAKMNLDPEIQLLLAVVVTVSFWRPIGALVQQYATTRPPNKREVESGIRAGNDLLKKYTAAPIIAPSAFQRIVGSGMVQIVLGSMAMAVILTLIGILFNISQLIVFTV